jgi:hypothetical protein
MCFAWDLGDYLVSLHFRITVGNLDAHAIFFDSENNFVADGQNVGIGRMR